MPTATVTIGEAVALHLPYLRRAAAAAARGRSIRSRYGDADDVTQEVCLHALKYGLGRYDPARSPLRNYLAMIGVNYVRRYARQRNPHGKVLFGPIGMDLVHPDLASVCEPPAPEGADASGVIDLAEALAGLDERERDAVCSVHGLRGVRESCADVARRFGMSQAGVRHVLRKAFAKLRKALG